MHRRTLLLFILSLAIFWAQSSQAQYMYIDTNGDGLHESGDRLTADSTSLEVWVDTAHNRDGSPASCSAGGDTLSIFSYEFILRTQGGTVAWGPYTNLRTEMQISFGLASDSTDYYNGFGGVAVNPPGLYHVGTLRVAVLSGNPSIEFVSTSHLGAFSTSFGSRCYGRDFDNTLKLGTDWSDADGVLAPDSPPEIVAPSSFSTEVGEEVVLTAEIAGHSLDGPPTTTATGYPPSLQLEVTQLGQSTSRVTISGQVGSDDAGTYQIIWSAEESYGVSATDTTVMNIIEQDRPPIVTAPGSMTILEGAPCVDAVSASDPDGQPINSLIANLSGLPAGNDATFTTVPNNTQGTFSWTPTYVDAGSYTVTFTATNAGVGSAATIIQVQNATPPPKRTRLQLPGPGYRVDVWWFADRCLGVPCNYERLAAGDSGQIYVDLEQFPDGVGNDLWDKIHLEFPARNSAAFFTVPHSTPWPLDYLNSDDLYIGQPVDWFPVQSLPPPNFDFVPTASSADFIRILHVADQVRVFWRDTYGLEITPEQIRLWGDLDVPTYITFPAGVETNFIQWPADVNRYNPQFEANAIAHEMVHAYQYRAIYATYFPSAGGGTHYGCESGDEERAWVEGMADGIAEYFTVTVRGERYGTSNNDNYPLEHITNQWTCPENGPNIEDCVAFYVYLMNRRRPQEFMNCLRSSSFKYQNDLHPRQAQQLSDFHSLWNDLAPVDGYIIDHAPGSASDQIIWTYAVYGEDRTGVELGSPPLDQFGSVRKVYPMPARGPVKVDALGPVTGSASIRIVQPTGRVVREFHFNGLTPQAWQLLDIDVSGLPAGVYFLWYSDSTEEDIKAGRKLVIMR